MQQDIHHGDMREVLIALAAEGVRFDACVTDPPYHLTSIVRRFGAPAAAPAKPGTDGAFARASRGFMGQTWDGGDIAFRAETWRAVYDVLKPGAHLVAFGGTRTVHRLTCAIEDAGLEVRERLRYDCAAETKYGALFASLTEEQRAALAELLAEQSDAGRELAWCYGSGFPKSKDQAKAIDKALGVAGTFGEAKTPAHAGWIDRGSCHKQDDGWHRPWMDDPAQVDAAARAYIPATDQARAWRGWGTALKPAYEPIIVARRPIDGSVARNLLAHGTGALNVDACRVPCVDAPAGRVRHGGGVTGAATSYELPDGGDASPAGRWPANLLHDGSPEVLASFPPAPGQQRATGPEYGENRAVNCYGDRGPRAASVPRGDAGSAERFFYCAKANAADRADSRHPTVKPIELLRWLIRLTVPRGGHLLDPFAGSGTTGEAAMLEGCRATLIEMRAEAVADIRHRAARWSGADLPMFATAAE